MSHIRLNFDSCAKVFWICSFLTSLRHFLSNKDFSWFSYTLRIGAKVFLPKFIFTLRNRLNCILRFSAVSVFFDSNQPEMIGVELKFWVSIPQELVNVSYTPSCNFSESHKFKIEDLPCTEIIFRLVRTAFSFCEKHFFSSSRIGIRVSPAQLFWSWIIIALKLSQESFLYLKQFINSCGLRKSQKLENMLFFSEICLGVTPNYRKGDGRGL